jgi:DNA-binding LacI/PurR family transcriptional regulator
MPVPLTTVAQPKFEIGSQAALLLLDQLSGRASAQHTVVLPTALVVRASSTVN